MEELIGSYMVYTLIFRLAIVAAGVVSIILGYKLFTRSNAQQDLSQEFSASAVGAKFLLKGGGSGTIFSLFGIVLISVMVLTNRPELVLEKIGKNSDLQDKVQSKSDRALYRYKFKGDGAGSENISFCVNNYMAEVNQSDDLYKKIEMYLAVVNICGNQNFELLFDSFNELALLYMEAGETRKALDLAKVTVLIYPEDAYYLDSLANIYVKLNQYEEAYRYAKMSVTISPQIVAHKETLQKIKSYLNRG